MATVERGWPKWMSKVDEWMDDARNQRAATPGRRSATQVGQGDVGRMHAQLDPWPSLVKAMGEDAMLHRLVMGSGGANGNLATTASRRNLLVLGPPRSAKTVGVLVPSILSHPGPVVSTSTKDDVFRATAIVRARMGRLWHYNPDGGETLPGCIPLRWSPIPASKDWSTAISLGKAMADVAELGSGSAGDSEYFRTKAGVLTAALLHAAALEDKSMLWMLKAVAGDRRTLDEAYEILDGSFAPEDQIAASDLRGIRDLEARAQSPIFSTTANAFAAYRVPAALTSTEDPNFDPDQFVAGDPLGFNPRRIEMLRPEEERPELAGLRFELQAVGVYDTVYLTASSSKQALVAPLVAGLLNQLREASFAMHRKDEARDNFTRPATLWALDEVAGIAPMRDLPETLTQSGGQGLIVAACLQDLHIARAKWDEADGFLTLFGNVVVFPGIRDEPTLRAISTVVGQHWINVSSSGTSGGRTGGQRQNTWNETTNQQLVARLEPGAVARGRVNEHPDYVLGLVPDGDGSDWFFATPYFRSPPWPHLIVSSMEWVAELGQVFEGAWDVPLPILNKDRSFEDLRGAGGDALVARYQRALEGLKHLAEGRDEYRSLCVDGSLLSGYDDSWVPTLPDSQLSFIALRDDPGPAKLNAALVAHPELRRAPDDYEATIWMSTKAGVQTPFGDLPDNPIQPEWLVRAGHVDVACLTVVDGGVETKVASGNTIINRHADEIPEAAALIEVWSTTRPGAHMVRRLAAELASLSPVAELTNEGLTFHGSPWQWSNGNDESGI